MLINRTGGGGENVTQEVNAQTRLLESIANMYQVVGKPEGATATADTILEGYTAYVGQTLVQGTYNPITADSDLRPENIREGVDIFGVVGNVVEGKSGVDYGVVYVTNRENPVVINHNLGVVPSYFMIGYKGNDTIYGGDMLIISGGITAAYDPSTGGQILSGLSDNQVIKSSTQITVNKYKYSSFEYRLKLGEYYWVAIA